MLRVTVGIEPDELLYNLHTRGLDLDDDVEFYDAVVIGAFPSAEHISHKTIPHDDAPEFGQLIYEIDQLWECLTMRPDWGSEEIEWCAEHIQKLRGLLYKRVESTFNVRDAHASITDDDSGYMKILAVTPI